jgi:thiol:disulfide interchange protein DsbA
MENTMTRKLAAAFCMMLLLPLNALAEAVPFEAGTHYAVLDTPVRTADSSKVEVVEVFWYGCSHCYSFEPIISEWKKSAPEYVDFWQSPAIWNAPMKVHAQAFFTAKALGVLDKVHDAMFTTLVVERKRLNNAEDIADLYADYGVNREKVLKTFNSFSVLSQTKQADARARSYKVAGTPEVIVNGKYRVTARMAGGHAGMIEVINYLVEKERSQLVVEAAN